MTSWREWEISEVWANGAVCPDCGESLIITHLVAPGIQYDEETGSDIHNGICPRCRQQYTVISNPGTLSPNLQASIQQDRIDALEERVARLEAIVQSLTERKPLSFPVTPEPNPEEADFRKKYGYLL